MHHVVIAAIIVIIAMLILCYFIMSHNTLILYYHAFMLTLAYLLNIMSHVLVATSVGLRRLERSNGSGGSNLNANCTPRACRCLILDTFKVKLLI